MIELSRSSSDLVIARDRKSTTEVRAQLDRYRDGSMRRRLGKMLAVVSYENQKPSGFLGMVAGCLGEKEISSSKKA